MCKNTKEPPVLEQQPLNKGELIGFFVYINKTNILRRIIQNDTKN